ncbi:transcription-repair coupling factor [candidate division KSB1 bacterium]|nr:transcription-repair coupling factor [candidate division KSB1 bacterium]
MNVDDVAYYPSLDNGIWSEIGPARTEVGQRISTLGSLIKGKVSVVLTTANALLEKVAEYDDVELYKINLHVGHALIFEQFVKQLVEMGFVREERVDAPGEMSVRGGIVDLFLFDNEHPVRIEFWGDDVESIRLFDVESQRSIEQRSNIEILPLGCAGPYGPIDERTVLDLDLQSSIFDYIADDFILWTENKALLQTIIKDYQRRVEVHFQRLADERHDGQIKYADYFYEAATISRYLDKYPSIDVVPYIQNEDTGTHLGIHENNHYGGNIKLFKQDVVNLLSTSHSTLALACDSDGQRDRMCELLREESFPQDIHIFTFNLSHGFSWPEKGVYLFTVRELYDRVRLHKPNQIEKRSMSFREQLSIKRGDYVVHDDYGIGQFEGLEKIKAYGKVQECLALTYQDSDKLYVPLEKMAQVQKYSSADGMIPTLSKLGSQSWDRLKKRTKKRIREITEDLLKLYATRKMRPGYAFSSDTVWQKELEASFQFEETIDQLSAISDVKKDMQTAQPMDRLICGDVGYGKTEVAVRAAFKAVNDGKQVAVLVPTTILAEQHYTTFSQRLSQYPIHMSVLSRFKTLKQQKRIIEQLGNGGLDIVIGTHRLLSKDVAFKDLGLLIVDEEQRFGVVHKEKLKLLKQTVDTLTLSATPIPRTMHMALMGAKDMSIINSPPHNRIPIKTEVSRFDEQLIREAILREIDRGGQVFFVHNRVQSIYGISAQLNKLIPEANIAVAHGQMKGHQLEKVMLKFIQGEVQVLVCTMIIESGIDMPKANTLIINRADKFGLAQLYQLRGRVGRSDVQAFAYLLVPPMRKLTRDAIKRLQTIQEYSELGSGYKIAMRDLEIRGAGNIFGAEQTGFVNALGYELYTKIIAQTIAEIKQELNVEDKSEQENGFEAKVVCAVDAYIPEDYIASQSERVDIYRRLVKAAKVETVEDIHGELNDRFGAAPACVQNLLDYILVKILATRARLTHVRIRKNVIEGEFDYDSLPAGDTFRSWLTEIIQNAPTNFEIKQSQKTLGFVIKTPPHQSSLNVAKKFLQSIV